eukprot:UC1_evm3s912
MERAGVLSVLLRRLRASRVVMTMLLQRLLCLCTLASLPLTIMSTSPPQTAAVTTQRLHSVDDYNVAWYSPSTSSLGAMPVGNGRLSANVWVEASSGDLMLTLGLADALDENSNLLKLGRLRIRTDPPLWADGASFSQKLVLSTGTIVIESAAADGSARLNVSVWVDAVHSVARIRIIPGCNNNGTATAASPFQMGGDGDQHGGDATTTHVSNMCGTDAAPTVVSVVAALENWRLAAGPILADFGNGWSGSGGSFCYSNGSVADKVFLYPDKLAPDAVEGIPGVRWYHRNDAIRANYFVDALREQGLGSLIGREDVFDPLTNRSWGASLEGVDGAAPAQSAAAAAVAAAARLAAAGLAAGKERGEEEGPKGWMKGGRALQQLNSTAIGTAGPTADPVDLLVSVFSGQVQTEEETTSLLAQAAAEARAACLDDQAREAHVMWWKEFFNRSYIRINSSSSSSSSSNSSDDKQKHKEKEEGGEEREQEEKNYQQKEGYKQEERDKQEDEGENVATQRRSLAAFGNRSTNYNWPTRAPVWVRHNGTVGDQKALIRQPGWPANGESPGACSAAFPSPLCVQQAAAMCANLTNCKSYALAPSWHGGVYPQVYTDGIAAATPNVAWTLFDNVAKPPSPLPPPVPPPSPNPPPPASSAGFLVSRQAVLMRYMDLCSSGRIGGGVGKGDFFALKYNGGILTSEPSPREDSRAWGPGQWWQNLRLPYYAMLRAGDTDMFKPLLRWYLALLPLAKGRTRLWYGQDRPGGVYGAWFIETMTQFGSFIPSEKGYHCPAVRDPAWPVWWAGNGCINLHREGSIELLALALDYWDHTRDAAEFRTSILPLSVAVTDWVRTYFGRRNDTGLLDIWPTQSLEGYQALFPPTRDNIIANDMPTVAGLHAVLPRLLVAGTETNVSAAQLAKWQDLLKVLPPLPTANSKSCNCTVFTAAQQPYAPNATHSGTEIPMMYPVHPYRLATAVVQSSSVPTRPSAKFAAAAASTRPPTGDKFVASRETLSGSRAESMPQVDLVQVARNTYAHGGGNNGNTGWNQQPINLAYLGLRDQAYASIVQRATTPPDKMRFPAYLPSMQDARPNEDHLSNMRVALQAMLVQHGDGALRRVIGMLPAWPCDRWSVSFKVHLPLQTIVEGKYDHMARRLTVYRVTPPERAADIRILGCANSTAWPILT